MDILQLTSWHTQLEIFAQRAMVDQALGASATSEKLNIWITYIILFGLLWHTGITLPDTQVLECRSPVLTSNFGTDFELIMYSLILLRCL